MKNEKKIAWVILGLLTLALLGCAHTGREKNSVLAGSAYGQQTPSDDAKSYALQQDADYSSQIKRNPYGQIVNPLVAPADQTYYFDLDSNALHQQDYQALGIQANYLAAHPNAVIRLEGNTDSRGSREYNIALGWRRDQSVQAFLAQHGVLRSQIKQVSYGKEHPAVLGDNEQAWQLNRRVNLVYEVK